MSSCSFVMELNFCAFPAHEQTTNVYSHWRGMDTPAGQAALSKYFCVFCVNRGLLLREKKMAQYHTIGFSGISGRIFSRCICTLSWEMAKVIIEFSCFIGPCERCIEAWQSKMGSSRNFATQLSKARPENEFVWRSAVVRLMDHTFWTFCLSTCLSS